MLVYMHSAEVEGTTNKLAEGSDMEKEMGSILSGGGRRTVRVDGCSGIWPGTRSAVPAYVPGKDQKGHLH